MTDGQTKGSKITENREQSKKSMAMNDERWERTGKHLLLCMVSGDQVNFAQRLKVVTKLQDSKANEDV